MQIFKGRWQKLLISIFLTLLLYPLIINAALGNSECSGDLPSLYFCTAAAYLIALQLTFNPPPNLFAANLIISDPIGITLLFLPHILLFVGLFILTYFLLSVIRDAWKRRSARRARAHRSA